MQAPNKRKNRRNSEIERQSQAREKCLSFASTEEAEALLTDLSTRSPSQREFFGKLLKRAASQVISADSEVDPADPHHTPTS